VRRLRSILRMGMGLRIEGMGGGKGRDRVQQEDLGEQKTIEQRW
jgi:hypothetical protein